MNNNRLYAENVLTETACLVMSFNFANVTMVLLGILGYMCQDSTKDYWEYWDICVRIPRKDPFEQMLVILFTYISI